MADELTLGEVQRNVVRHEREMEAIRTQVTNLAREAVTVTQFAHEIGSLRRELAGDRAQMEELAKERHRAMMEKLDSIKADTNTQLVALEKGTNARLETLEKTESARPMNNWIKFGITASAVVGIMGLVIGLISILVHH